MKCLAAHCTNTIDELRPTPTVEIEGRTVVNVTEQKAYQAELACWEHVTVVRGNTTVVSGHVCPSHGTSGFDVSVAGKE